VLAACPDVEVHDLTPEHEFIVLACDGIWDVLTNQEVLDFIRVRISKQMEPQIVSEGDPWCVGKGFSGVGCVLGFIQILLNLPSTTSLEADDSKGKGTRV
jgi:hypothetical protein